MPTHADLEELAERARIVASQWTADHLDRAEKALLSAKTMSPQRLKYLVEKAKKNNNDAELGYLVLAKFASDSGYLNAIDIAAILLNDIVG
jgi:hypothetical protein